MKNEKAPGAAPTAAEGKTGTINEEGTESVMNTVTPTTVTSTMTPEQADFAARFADYEIVVRVSVTATLGPTLTETGRWFFCAGGIIIRPATRQIIVTAASGAYIENLEMLRQAAEGLRTGTSWSPILDKLREHVNPETGATAYRTKWLGWHSDEQWVDAGGMKVVSCSDGRCSQTWHEYDDTTALGTPRVMHGADTIRHSAGRYVVSMSRITAEPWKVSIDLPDYDLTVFDARSLCNDVAWLSAECDKLNATEAVAS